MRAGKVFWINFTAAFDKQTGPGILSARSTQALQEQRKQETHP